MPITRLQMGIAALLALLLHGGLAVWLGRIEPATLPDPPPLRVSLLAPVAEATVAAAPAVPEPPLPVAEPLPEPPPKPRPAPKPRPVPEPAPKPEPEPEPELREVVAEPQPVTPPVAEAASEPAPPEPVVAQPDEEAAARYEQLLLAWLERHKRYPRRAKRLRIEGEGMLRLRIGRDGKTLHVAIAQSAGNRLLDRAMLEMARRANPFPPFPEQDPRAELEFSVPVVFMLR